MDPWDPLPWTVTRTLAVVDSTGPAAVATSPAAGAARTCWPSATSGLGIASASPSSTMAWAPWAVSSPGWKRATYVPLHASVVSARTAAAPSPAVMWRSWPQACITPGTSDR